MLDAAKQLTQLGDEQRCSAVRPIDVEPEIGCSRNLRNPAEIIDNACIRRPGGRYHADAIRMVRIGGQRRPEALSGHPMVVGRDLEHVETDHL